MDIILTKAKMNMVHHGGRPPGGLRGGALMTLDIFEEVR
jgi:hypothetical protein